MKFGIMRDLKKIEPKNILIYPTAKIINIENIEFGHDIIIDDFVFIYAKKKIKIGNNVHIGAYTSIMGGQEFEMGDFTALSLGVRIFTATDDFMGWGFGNSTTPEKYRNTKREKIKIGKFCIIGANSVILPGVEIGEGATIGACSVISKDCEPWGVYCERNKKVYNRNKLSVLETYKKYQDESNRSI